MNIRQYKQMLKLTSAIQMPSLVVSGPGLGKTQAIAQVAAEMTIETGRRHEFFAIVLGNHDVWDLSGFNVPTRNAAGLASEMTTPFWWHNIAHWDGITCWGFLLLDEMPDADMPTQKVAARIINDREVGGRKLPAGCIPLMAGNRRKDRTGANRLASMFQNRLSQVELEFNSELLVAHLQDEGFHEAGLSFIKLSPQYVYNETVPDEPGPFVSPRSFEKGVRALDHLGRAAGLKNNALPGTGTDDIDIISQNVLAGWVGAGSAAQFLAHLKYQHELPTVEDIVLDPMKAKLPKGMGAQYMISFMLGGRATDANLPSMCQYFTRMSVEFQVVTMRQWIERVRAKKELPTLFGTPGVTNWMQANQQLVMVSA